MTVLGIGVGAAVSQLLVPKRSLLFERFRRRVAALNLSGSLC